MLSALRRLLTFIVGEILLGIVRRAHRRTLASYGIDVEHGNRPSAYREHGEGTIRDYLVLGDDRNGFLTLHCDDERVQVMALAQPPVTSA